ncbi:tyrosine-type recombinase/integrase [Flavivirga aquimarina]|uniref:Tyrosine-type recombinase/integrase n=1 Tax=Flavivirga aquimarina TaxID=2027862 RepID=A0ABT8WB86_9FLAO|nr:phage integrase SAM-like domain-containing protein [Flavivirga aquimarina]MDO5970287.1 tyrosine-type recombinase/integrase [Flavivirga aquimarina]
MSKIKIAFDKRSSNTTKDNKYPLVLRLSHKRKTRDIPFNIHLREDQYNFETKKITGILNAVKHTKRTLKIYSNVDLWVDEHEGEIKNWDIARLKREIEQRFFNIAPSRTILSYGAVYLNRLRLEKRFSTADSYEDALKLLVKFKKSLKGQDDTEKIKTLYEIKDGKMQCLDEFKDWDMEIKAMDYGFVRDFKAYMSNRYESKNTPNIYLRSLQAIMNDAGNTFEDLSNHKPLSKIKKKSHANAPSPLDLDDIDRIRNLRLKPDTPIWHNHNYMLFMFNNMGMNFFDIGLIKRFQFEDNRIKYFRKKTHYEGDYFNINQNDEALEIINHYLNGQKPDDYLFPIIPNGTTPERLHLVNKARVKSFNKYAAQIAKLAGVTKKITTYTMRDTWTNIGLDMGIDIRKISSGLGHSSVQVTEKHYSQSISEKILDEINAKITGHS